jgi:hypothetical protein
MGTKPTPLAMATGELCPRLALVFAAGSMSVSEVSAMPTVIEPKTNEEAKAQPVPPVSNEPELFAAEVAMEGKSSGLMPLVLIAGLILVVGGTIFYFVKGARDVLTVPLATSTVTRILDEQGPATIRFSTGTVVSTVNEKPQDPHYKLLAKTGVIVTKPKAKGSSSLLVALTPAGEKLFSTIKGVQKVSNPDGTVTYVVPLAERKLVDVANVTMIKPHLARVEYSWKWDPNRLGVEFDASGSLVKSFSGWDRATLIKTYGADFYGAPPTKASIVLMESDNGTWKPYVE